MSILTHKVKNLFSKIIIYLEYYEHQNTPKASNAGTINDQNEAAVITPAANPKLASKNERLYPLNTKTIAEPAAVNAQLFVVALLKSIMATYCNVWLSLND
ncbi:hypothetical protein BpHYR1_041971 [Brachionus plicatilis]|uniref:Uncharacterized protein n=1 Tax=Brachionus plicatilis TaxID=10195 RepID=A0A3M7QC07_BRAPC|nr:hypothetical protein BpHYR1_041971 [Brachionus plicatilis]